MGPYLPPIFYPERGAVRTLEETSLGTKLSTKGDVDVSNSYSRTSDKGPSERKTASLERDCPKNNLFPIAIMNFWEKNSDKLGWSEVPLFTEKLQSKIKVLGPVISFSRLQEVYISDTEIYPLLILCF